MIGKYSEEDLTHGGDSPEEHERLRAIFDDLIVRGKAGIPLSDIEEDFVFHALVSLFNENPNNFPFVESARFRSCYLTYGMDLSGGSRYWTTRFGRVIQVPPLEKANHLEYLHQQAKIWEAKSDPKQLYPEGILKEAIMEAREDRKQLDKIHNIAGRPELAGTFFFENLVEGVYLRAASNYYFGTKYWNETDPADFTFTFCGETIEYTAFSLVHIINRHFAERTKQYESGKDYHTEDIIPWAMAGLVKQILTEIDATGLFTRQVKTVVNLRFKGEIYQFWAEFKNKSVKGHKGPVRYKRVQTFFRVTDAKTLSDLRHNHKEVTINPELSVFVPI